MWALPEPAAAVEPEMVCVCAPPGGCGLIGHCRISRGSIYKTSVAPAVKAPRGFLVLQVMGMRPGARRSKRTLGMGMAWHLRCCQRHCGRTACLFCLVEITVGRTDPHRHPAAAPRHPSTSKISSGIDRSDAHIDTAYRIHRFGKLLDVFLQEHSIDFHIPVLSHLKGIVAFRYLSNRHTFTAILKSMTTAAVETISCTEMVENASSRV